jgi:WD40 repeat protein
MKKIVLIFLVFLIGANKESIGKALNIRPLFMLKTSAGSTDAVYLNGKLYVGTELGTVEIFDLHNKKKITEIKLPQILNFFEEYYSPKVYSVDFINKKLLILAEDEEGFSSLFIYENNKLNKIITKKDRLIIKKAKFVSENQVILALLSDEIILFDLKTKKQIYRKQISTSPFSNFALSPDRKKIAVVTEGGVIYIVDTKNGNIIRKIENTHVDKIFSIDYKDKKIITGGRDRRVYVHNLEKGISIRFDADFFVYAVGLSPTGQKGAYQLNENADISIINLKTNKQIFSLKGYGTPLIKLIFIDENSLISLEESPKIYFWRLSK